MVTQQGRPKNNPANWSLFKVEIDALLREGDPGYKERLYITPLRYIDGIKDNPEKYPLLSKESIAIQKRYISYFLKEQGRISRGEKARKHVWILPEAKE